MSIQINSITSTDSNLTDLVWQINDRLDYIAREIGKEVLLPSDTSISISRDRNSNGSRVGKAIVARKIKLSEVDPSTVRKNTIFISNVDGHIKFLDRDGALHNLTQQGGSGEYLGINDTAVNSYLLEGMTASEFALANHLHFMSDVIGLEDALENIDGSGKLLESGLGVAVSFGTNYVLNQSGQFSLNLQGPNSDDMTAKYSIATGTANSVHGTFNNISGSNNSTDNSSSYCSINGASNSTPGSHFLNVNGYQNQILTSNDVNANGDSNPITSSHYINVNGVVNPILTSNNVNVNGDSNHITTSNYINTVGKDSLIENTDFASISGTYNSASGSQFLDINGSQNQTTASNYVNVNGIDNSTEDSYCIGVSGFTNSIVGSEYSNVGGLSNTINNMHYSSVSGYSNTGSGNGNTVSGYSNTVRGAYNCVTGKYNETGANSTESFLAGLGNRTDNENVSMVGRYAKDAIDLTFAVGDGFDEETRSNSFEVLKSGLVKAPKQPDVLINDDDVATKKHLSNTVYLISSDTEVELNQYLSQGKRVFYLPMNGLQLHDDVVFPGGYSYYFIGGRGGSDLAYIIITDGVSFLRDTQGYSVNISFQCDVIMSGGFTVNVGSSSHGSVIEFTGETYLASGTTTFIDASVFMNIIRGWNSTYIKGGCTYQEKDSHIQFSGSGTVEQRMWLSGRDVGNSQTDPQTAINTANISTNTADISTNTTNINNNETSISNMIEDVNENAIQIEINTVDINSNVTEISNNLTRIDDNTTSINNNISDIANIVSDLSNKLETVAVDGVTITGDGTAGNPLEAVSSSSAQSISQVLAVGSDAEENIITNLSLVDINDTNTQVDTRSFNIWQWANGIENSTKEYLVSFKNKVLLAAEASIASLSTNNLVVGAKAWVLGKSYMGNSDTDLGGILNISVAPTPSSGYTFASSPNVDDANGVYEETELIQNGFPVHKKLGEEWYMFKILVGGLTHVVINTSVIDGDASWNNVVYRQGGGGYDPDGTTYDGLYANGAQNGAGSAIPSASGGGGVIALATGLPLDCSANETDIRGVPNKGGLVNVQMIDDAKDAFDATYGIVDYSGSLYDPDTYCDDMNFLANNNTPDGLGAWWYFTNIYYGTKSPASRKTQVARGFNGVNLGITYTRGMYDSVWSPWRKMSTNIDLAGYLKKNSPDTISTDIKVDNANGVIYNLDTNMITIDSVKGGTLASSLSSFTGYIIVELPTSRMSNMIRFDVDIYSYDSANAHKITIEGYNYSSTPYWTRCKATQLGSGSEFYYIQYLDNPTTGKAYVAIGHSTTIWKYPQVSVNNVKVSYNSGNLEQYTGEWVVTASNTLPGDIIVGLYAQNIASNSLELGGIPADNFPKLDAPNVFTDTQTVKTLHDTLLSLESTTTYSGLGLKDTSGNINIAAYQNAMTIRLNNIEKFRMEADGTIKHRGLVNSYGGDNGSVLSHTWRGTYDSSAHMIRMYSVTASGGASTGSAGFELYNRASNRFTAISPNNDRSIKIQNEYGKLDIGPKNASYCHYYTDRPIHYFDKPIQISGENVITANAMNTALELKEDTNYSEVASAFAGTRYIVAKGASDCSYSGGTIKVVSTTNGIHQQFFVTWAVTYGSAPYLKVHGNSKYSSWVGIIDVKLRYLGTYNQPVIEVYMFHTTKLRCSVVNGSYFYSGCVAHVEASSTFVPASTGALSTYTNELLIDASRVGLVSPVSTASGVPVHPTDPLMYMLDENGVVHLTGISYIVGATGGLVATIPSNVAPIRDTTQYFRNSEYMVVKTNGQIYTGSGTTSATNIISVNISYKIGN